MESHVWWTSLEFPGLEHLRLVEDATGVVADSLVLGIEGATPFHLWYKVRTDRNWNVRECLLRVEQADGKPGQTLHLYCDAQGHWTSDEGGPLSHLDGCVDLDISHTPFTNTLPIRRLALAPGESAELLVAYVTVPDLTVHPARQRYTCLSHTSVGAIYRFEGLESHFTSELSVDAQGLVVEYPGLWKRVEMQPREESGRSQPKDALEGLLAAGPQPAIADKLQLFGQFVGDWDADWTAYQPGGAVGQTGKGEIHFAWALDGRAVQDVWIFPTRADLRRGFPIDEWGSTLRIYDPSADTWTISWHSAVNHVVRTLTARPVGDEVWVEGANTQGQPLRWTFSRITDRSFHWSNFISEDAGQTWRLQEELEAHRVE